MNKFCIFCGKKPKTKTKEHIIPQWLIELTGSPKRQAYFGFNKNFNKKLKKRIFAFDQFVFPSCKDCNDKYSELENNVKNILSKIISNDKISTEEITIFFNWMDKVRVGLWLGFIQLDKNYAGIEPKFHIENRIGLYDRILKINKSDFKGKRLNFTGVETYSFTLTPSAFQLIVNNYFFLNISYMFLFSRRIGFPYPSEVHLLPDNFNMEVDFSKGKERIIKPLIKKPTIEPYIELYQPMIPLDFKKENDVFYNTKYIKDHCYNHEKGIGNIFKVENGNITECKKGEKISIEPTFSYDDDDILMESAIQIYKWQNWLNEQPINFDRVSSKQKKFYVNQIKMAIKINNKFIKYIQTQKIIKK